MANITENRTSLSKSDIRKSYWLWQFFSHANYNYERMQGTSFAMSMAPVLKKLYPAKQDLIDGLKRHLTFFNTDPNFGAVIHGVAIAMEEEKANGADISGDSINAIKVGLMGPLAGIGDTLVQGIIIPLMVAIGISFGVDGNLFGPLFVLIGLPIVLMTIAYNSWMRGYQLGSSAVTTLLSGGKMKRIIGAAGILGCTVMGGLISQFVNLQTTIVFHVGQESFDLQAKLFDAIMPHMLPLAATLGVYLLLKSNKVNSLQILIGMIVIGFFGGLFGIL